MGGLIRPLAWWLAIAIGAAFWGGVAVWVL